MAGKREPVASSSYSTGGGGTVLEHQYGAVLLSHLLAGDPVPGLGGDAVLQSVHFQAKPESPVDDFLLVGQTPDGEPRRVSVGMRRAPKLTSTDVETVGLLATYVRALAQDWPAISEGRWLLALAVASPNPAVRQLRSLCRIAKSCRSNDKFRKKVDRSGETNDGVRGRLPHVDALVKKAFNEAAVDIGFPLEELTWQLLSVVRVQEVRLEDGDDTDRVHAITRLRSTISDQSVISAHDLFRGLYEQVAQYGPAGEEVTEASLRRDLAGAPLSRSSTHAQAWRILDALSGLLRDRTRAILSDGSGSLTLERSTACEALSATMLTAAEGPGALVVTGEPGTGKSALTLQAAQRLAEDGWAVNTLSLRDLPGSLLDLEGRLGGTLTEILGATAVGRGRLLVIDGSESVLEGRDQLLTQVATAALRVGLGVVCVTRSDGRKQTSTCLDRALEAADWSETTPECEVTGLDPTEVDQIAAAFPGLAQLAGNGRTAWILTRPGLVDLLLRSGGGHQCRWRGIRGRRSRGGLARLGASR